MTVLGIVCSIITGIVMMSTSGNKIEFSRYEYYYVPDTFFFSGFILLFVGPLASWLSMLVLYGFGHLICQVDALVNKNNPSTKNEENKNDFANYSNEFGNYSNGYQNAPNNHESYKSESVLKKRATHNYNCNYYKPTGKYRTGTCYVCYVQNETVEMCKIKDDMPTREWPLCEYCKDRYRLSVTNNMNN